MNDLFGLPVVVTPSVPEGEVLIGSPVLIGEASQCAFLPFTPVPRAFAGQWVKLVVCEAPNEKQGLATNPSTGETP